jgi:hypothetical protein
MLKVKLLARGKALTPYVAMVHQNGAQQKRFKEQYGIPVGNCVRSNVHKGMSIGAIHEAVRACARGRKA